MARKKIEKSFARLYNEARLFKKRIEYLLDPKERRELGKNICYKNRYAGERCFIIGNGPSLRQQDLALIKDEKVFTVNYMYNSLLYNVVAPDFHVMLDPLIFQFDMHSEADKEKLEGFKKINLETKKPVCIFPYTSKDTIEEVGLNTFLNISYIDCASNIYDGFNKTMDMKKPMFAYSNVVHFAISIAIYMGFSEIYLLGCDMTGYEQISVLAGKEVDLHVYKMTDTEKKLIKQTHNKIDPETFFEGFYRMFADYRRLYEYTRKRNIHLYNATAGGVLDCIPRVDYNTLFNDKERKNVKQ